MNSITVTIPFSFKGKEFSPAAVIDLDAFIKGDQTLDSVYQLVANENKIDNYSYEYEVLQSSPKFFSEPTGLASEFLSGNSFDFEGFKNRFSQTNHFETLRTIAKETMGIENLDEHETLKQALQQAYLAGKNQNNNT